ncbi:hypothetical protein ccbrp13_18980 [Ktedonobacteria bacterium brp13]|nr:hypothetical protein ccbrp13_18980 [Ktedonobacteria bacterium brp13]
MTMATPLATNAEAQEAQHFLRQIKSWPHWEKIQQVAQKEYSLSAQDADQLLAEYQRFLVLIKRHPNQRIGMYSNNVDKLWHAHILSTILYADYCERHHGHFLHHSPTHTKTHDDPPKPPETPPPTEPSKPPETPPPGNCIACDYNEDPRDSGKTTSWLDFRLIYFQAFQQYPPSVWDVRSADAIVTI